MAVSHHDHVVHSTNTAPTPAPVDVAMAPSAMLQGFDGYGIRASDPALTSGIASIGVSVWSKRLYELRGYSKKKGKEQDHDHHHHNEIEYESEHELEDEDEYEIEAEDEFELEDEKLTIASWMTKTNKINILLF
nr:early nodulin-like protein 14 [Tanacetum cinerariifolium]GEZ36969.1 early nodulin-like protein 14 [Tanacetum cinerariifolium]